MACNYFIYHSYQPPVPPDTMQAVYNYYGNSTPSPFKFYFAYASSPIKWKPYLADVPPAPKLDPNLPQQLPFVFELHQNYPNPFNPTTTISFTLDEPAQTFVTIYNLLGQRVTTLIDVNLPAGEKAIVWNGTDENGREVSSGVYFYLIQSGKHTESKKMTLLR